MVLLKVAMQTIDCLLDRYAELVSQEKALERLEFEASIEAILNRVRSNRAATRIEIKRLFKESREETLG